MPVQVQSRIQAARVPTAHTVIGDEASAGSGLVFESLSPATGELLAEVATSSPEQVDRAVATAARAHRQWRRVEAARRAALLEDLAARILADGERLATLIVLDNGKTMREAQLDVHACAALLRTAAGWAVRLKGTTLEPENSLVRMTWREPVGVVAVLMPFNAPLMFAGMKVGAALGTGNTVVVKAPERSPLVLSAFLEHVLATGIPAGVVNLVQGAGDVGARLVAAQAVDMVSFTGSSAVGAIVGAAAVSRLKRLLLELGGKSANIVYDDADVPLAAAGSLGAIFRNAGQRCFSGSRLLVQESVADSFLEAYVNGAAALRVGDPFDERTQVGALIGVSEVERIERLIEDAQAAGATVLTGGERPAGTHPGGAFLTPTVLDVSACPEHHVVREEIFGPVVVVQRFGADDEAIQAANASTYGLAGGCWTGSINRALRTAREVDTGYFWVNSYGTHGGAESTIGGRHQSGFGQEMGEDGVLAYTAIKSVQFDSGDGRSVIPM